MVEQARQILVERDDAHVARAVEPLVDQRDGVDARLRFAERVLRHLVAHRIGLQADQRRDERQAVGDAVVDFGEQHLGPVARHAHFLLGGFLLRPEAGLLDGLLQRGAEQDQKIVADGLRHEVGGAGLERGDRDVHLG